MKWLAALLIGVGLVSLPVPSTAYVPPNIWVHRYNHPSYDEETVPAIKARKRGEVDVQLTKDHVLVCLHDKTLSRLTNGQDTRRVQDLTLAEVQAVTLRRGGHIATLDQAIRNMNNGMIAELKEVPKYHEDWVRYGFPELRRLITKYHVQNKFFVVYPTVASDLSRVYPGIKTLWRAGVSENPTVDHVKKKGYDFVQLSPQWYKKGVVNNLKKAGIIVGTRTIRSKAQWRAAWNAGIYSNYQANGTTNLLKWVRAARS